MKTFKVFLPIQFIIHNHSISLQSNQIVIILDERKHLAETDRAVKSSSPIGGGYFARLLLLKTI